MSRKKIFYIVFFIALALGFYFILTWVNPEIGKKRLPPVSYVRPFSFVNQDGKAFTQQDVQGKVYVAEYFFTTCEGICIDMNQNLMPVYEEFKDEPDFLILSHTSMPEVDTPQRLKYFADSLGVDTRKWVFLTGRKDSLYNAARLSYTIDDPANNLQSIDDQFIHSQFMALVDRNGDVRKIFDGLRQSEMNDMKKQIKKLLREKD
jgi:protein SCO1/2